MEKITREKELEIENEGFFEITIPDLIETEIVWKLMFGRPDHPTHDNDHPREITNYDAVVSLPYGIIQ